MAFWAKGTKLQRGDGASPEVFTTIPEIRDITFPPLTTDFVDVTNHDSVGDFEEVIPTIRRSGELVAEMNYLPQSATQNVMLTDQAAKVKRNFKMIMIDPANTEWAFTAYVVGFEVTGNVEEAYNATLRLKVTGEPIIT